MFYVFHVYLAHLLLVLNRHSAASAKKIHSLPVLQLRVVLVVVLVDFQILVALNVQSAAMGNTKLV